jgi:hypothetical protein
MLGIKFPRSLSCFGMTSAATQNIASATALHPLPPCPCSQLLNNHPNKSNHQPLSQRADQSTINYYFFSHTSPFLPRVLFLLTTHRQPSCIPFRDPEPSQARSFYSWVTPTESSQSSDFARGKSGDSGMGFDVAVGFWLGGGFVAVERGEEGAWVS